MTWVSIDSCVVPIGVGVSLSPFIAACQRLIAQSGLKSQLGPNGTAIEGPWDEVMPASMPAIRNCIEWGRQGSTQR